MSSDEGEDELGIVKGSMIDSTKAKYVVINLLGEGGFGAVYKVHLAGETSKEYALKVEKKLETRKHSKLKMEIAILKLAGAMRAERSHFTKIVDRGKKPTYFFLVMELVGKSLADLKAVQRNKVFSVGTGLGVACQCLESVEDLHTHGYIHRDLKPANYACGLGTQKHVIFILDFGIARRIVKDNAEQKTPRSIVGFKGTVRFASLACHKNEDMSKKDDCESWYYLLMDLLLITGLPWRKMQEKADVRACKTRCRLEGSTEMDSFYFGHAKCRPQLSKILAYIDGLIYAETPDYNFIYTMLREAGAKCDVPNIDAPYDWEDDAATQKTKRQQSAG